LGSRNGVTEIKEHAWFSEIDFDAILAMTTYGPIIPKITEAEPLSYTNIKDTALRREDEEAATSAYTTEEFKDF